MKKDVNFRIYKKKIRIRLFKLEKRLLRIIFNVMCVIRELIFCSVPCNKVKISEVWLKIFI